MTTPTGIAIVGSRTFPTHEARAFIFNFVAATPGDTTIVSGGAIGPDTEGARAARFYRRTLTVHLPDWDRLGRSAGMIRNGLIERDSARCVALWDGASCGTRNTIDRFRRAGKSVRVEKP